MPRKRRLFIPDLPQHVVQRGVDRQPVFFSDSDCARYLNTFSEYAELRNISLHAYCLMTNHTHLLVSAKEKGALSACMQELGRKFVSTTNRIRSRTGGLWEGRFYAGYLEPEGYLLRCMRYIELNPVRAKMVANAGAYRWSSFSANATGRENVMITPHPVYQKLGDTQEARAYAYRKSFDEEPEGVDRSVIDEEIRSATRQGVLIAGTTYAADVARRLNREVTAKPRGRPKKKGPEKGA
jgi:putative transposase